jgi:hypothetical protein
MKANKFISISLEILTGRYPIDEDKIRQENINYIFDRAICAKFVIEYIYNYHYSKLKDNHKTLVKLMKLFKIKKYKYDRTGLVEIKN